MAGKKRRGRPAKSERTAYRSNIAKVVEIIEPIMSDKQDLVVTKPIIGRVVAIEYQGECVSKGNLFYQVVYEDMDREEFTRDDLLDLALEPDKWADKRSLVGCLMKKRFYYTIKHEKIIDEKFFCVCVCENYLYSFMVDYETVTKSIAKGQNIVMLKCSDMIRMFSTSK